MLNLPSTTMTRFHLAKRLVLVIELGLLLAGVMESGRAQITITTKDMFSKEGQYYKMYSNFVKHSSSEDEAGEEVDVSDYIRGRWGGSGVGFSRRTGRRGDSF